MNKPKSPQFSTPKFQTATDEHRFKERSPRKASFKQDKPQRFERAEKSADQKFGKNRPQFKENTRPSFSREPQITETQLGGVKVMVKSTSDAPKVKKTGALSPRAPEKIKKNRAEEMKIFGENACLTLFAQRPEAIVRVWTTVEMAHKVGELFSYLAANKKVYHVVDRAEMELVSGSEHHGGICMLVKKPRPFTLSGYLDIPRQADCLIMLDGVANNPQNLGGILRTCAFYGVKSVVSSQPEMLLSANAARVAEGALEYVHILQSDYADTALNQLRKAGYQILYLSADKSGKSLQSVKFSDKVALVLAQPELAQPQEDVVVLSHANPLKTGLNVAVATGVLLAKWVGR